MIGFGMMAGLALYKRHTYLADNGDIENLVNNAVAFRKRFTKILKDETIFDFKHSKEDWREIAQEGSDIIEFFLCLICCEDVN